MNIQEVVEKFHSEIAKLETIKSEFCIHPEKEMKYDYTIRFSIAANIVKSLVLGDISPPNAEILIRRNVTPVRPNRSYSRKPRAKAQIQFTYRIA